MSTYSIPLLLREYLLGSRLWMYKEVEDWLGLDPAAEGHGLFVLLAEPGMGKSVFSAVLTNSVTLPMRTATEGGAAPEHRVEVREGGYGGGGAGVGGGLYRS